MNPHANRVGDLIDSMCQNWSHCEDCGTCDPKFGDLLIASADFGEGFFLAVLCDQCWHRRQYRAKLQHSRLLRNVARMYSVAADDLAVELQRRGVIG